MSCRGWSIQISIDLIDLIDLKHIPYAQLNQRERPEADKMLKQLSIRANFQPSATAMNPLCSQPVGCENHENKDPSYCYFCIYCVVGQQIIGEMTCILRHSSQAEK